MGSKVDNNSTKLEIIVEVVLKMLPHVLRMLEKMTYRRQYGCSRGGSGGGGGGGNGGGVEEVVVVEEMKAKSLTVEKTMMEQEGIREIFYVNGMKVLAF